MQPFTDKCRVCKTKLITIKLKTVLCKLSISVHQYFGAEADGFH